MLNFRKYLFVFFLLAAVAAKKAESLNMFELSLMGIGLGFVADQYFDSSLNGPNSYALKREVVDEFSRKYKTKFSSNLFDTLPIHEKLLLIEELEKF